MLSSFFNILLADDHVMFRQGIRKILENIEGLEVVGEAGDGLELLDLVKKTLPNLVLMDISMPNLRGLEAAREIKKINPATKVLILTIHKEEEYLQQALSDGVKGYLIKEDADSTLLLAIDILRKGGTYISPLLRSQLAHLFMHRSQPETGLISPSKEHLTTREREIITLIAQGKSSKEIAKLLRLSERTVHCHRENIMKKLNIKNIAELVKYALQQHYVDPPT